MTQQLLGVPGMNLGLAKTFINEAFTSIQNEGMWSFQMKTGGWLTPGLLGANGATGQPGTNFLSPGTISVVPYTTTITGDAVATAAWLATIFNPPFITQYQFRIPYFSLYNAIALGYTGSLAYVTVTSPGAGQTPGVYVLNGTGIGTGAQIMVTVNSNGTVTIPPVVLSQGSGYQNADLSPAPPVFTIAHGGTPASFLSTNIATITIDRQWMEPAQVNAGYMAYMAYFPCLPGHKRFWAIRDTTNNNAMDFWSKTQIDLAVDDAERTIFDQPYYVSTYGQDQRTGSATLGQLLQELWPHPITSLPYTFHCQCNWPALSDPSDTVPYPLTEECVKWRAYEQAYIWKESQRGDDMERGSGANWQFLSQAAHAEYVKQLKLCRNMDRNLVELYFTKAKMSPPYGGEPFSTVSGQLNVGSF